VARRALRHSAYEPFSGGRTSFDGRVNVTGYRYFYVIEDEIEFANAPLPDKSDSNGLVSPTVHGAVITSGIADGPVLVTVDVLDEPPATVETELWEEIVEIAVETSTGRVWFGSFDEGAGTGPPVVLAEKTAYRLRVHCRGRDTNRA
jgi:hypothetical protein